MNGPSGSLTTNGPSGSLTTNGPSGSLTTNGPSRYNQLHLGTYKARSMFDLAARVPQLGEDQQRQERHHEQRHGRAQAQAPALHADLEG